MCPENRWSFWLLVCVFTGCLVVVCVFAGCLFAGCLVVCLFVSLFVCFCLFVLLARLVVSDQQDLLVPF